MRLKSRISAAASCWEPSVRDRYRSRTTPVAPGAGASGRVERRVRRDIVRRVIALQLILGPGVRPPSCRRRPAPCPVAGRGGWRGRRDRCGLGDARAWRKSGGTLAYHVVVHGERPRWESRWTRTTWSRWDDPAFNSNSNRSRLGRADSVPANRVDDFNQPRRGPRGPPRGTRLPRTHAFEGGEKTGADNQS